MWFWYDWFFEAGSWQRSFIQCPNPWQSNTWSLRHMSGCIPAAFFSFPSCISKEIPGCHEAFSQKQSYNGNFRHAWRPEDADPCGKGEEELWKGSRPECADGDPRQGALFTVTRGRCCPWCNAGRAKEALLLPLYSGG